MSDPRYTIEGQYEENLKKVSEIESELEERLNRSYLVGQSVGLKEASEILLKQAIDLWSFSQDEKANMLRDISKQLEILAKERHPGVPK